MPDNRKVSINVLFEFYPEENDGFREYYQSMSYDLLKTKVKEILDAQFLELPLQNGLWWHFEDEQPTQTNCDHSGVVVANLQGEATCLDCGEKR